GFAKVGRGREDELAESGCAPGGVAELGDGGGGFPGGVVEVGGMPIGWVGAGNSPGGVGVDGLVGGGMVFELETRDESSGGVGDVGDFDGEGVETGVKVRREVDDIGGFEVVAVTDLGAVDE